LDVIYIYGFCFFFISSLVIFYRDDYIHGDLNINRFILMVLLFVLYIIFLIIRPNMISILLGWDGLGLVSIPVPRGFILAVSNRQGHGIHTILGPGHKSNNS
jgi:hypothetical protein